MPRGLVPVAIVDTTRSVAVSITETLFDPSLDAYANGADQAAPWARKNVEARASASRAGFKASPGAASRFQDIRLRARYRRRSSRGCRAGPCVRRRRAAP